MHEGFTGPLELSVEDTAMSAADLQHQRSDCVCLWALTCYHMNTVVAMSTQYISVGSACLQGQFVSICYARTAALQRIYVQVHS